MDFKDCVRMQHAFVKAQNEMVLKGLTREELIWQPFPNARSIGILYFNQARFMDHYLHSGIQKTLDIWETQGWYEKFDMPKEGPPLTRTPEQIMSFIVPNIELIVGYETAARDALLTFLEITPPEDYYKKPDYPAGSHPNLGDLLATGVINLTYHLGQMLYLRNLQRGDIGLL